MLNSNIITGPVEVVTVPQPVEIPGEDVQHPPFPPVGAVEANRRESEYWATHSRDDARPEWDDLADDEKVAEIRRGTDSEFYLDFEDDPVVQTRCPECGPTVMREDGLCEECGRDLCGPVPSFDDLRGWVA